MRINRIGENIFFNVLKTGVSILYPLITFSYVARILSVESIGSVTFAKNIASYFCLFASLGISYYGTREGAKVANDKKMLSKLFWEILFINVLTTIFSITVYLIIVFTSGELSNYKILLLINTTTIVLSGLSSEWVLGAVEKYKFISIRTMLIQLICMIGMVCFVNEKEDYSVYAILLVISGYGSSVFNWIYIVKNNLVYKPIFKKIEMRKHIKPILVLFSMLLSIDIYTLMDTTMLGVIQGDWAVGIYSAAIKVPRLVNSLIAAVGTVLVPRLSFYYEVDKGKFYKLIHYAMTFVFMITIPCAIGVFGVSEEIILLLCGEQYTDATLTLRILSPLILIIPISVLFNNQIFIPMRKEIYVLNSTCVGAVVNVIANMLLISRYAENGAAVATVLAEISVMFVCLYHVKRELTIQNMGKIYVKGLLTGASIIPILIFVRIFVDHMILRLLLSVVLSGCVFLYLSWTTIKKLIYREE